MDHPPFRIAAALAAALICACGSSNKDNGSGNKGPPDAGPPPPPPSTQVALDLQTAGKGMVRGAGADCRGNCHLMYNTGAAVHLEAVPDSGYAFTGWSGACSGSSACDLTLSANASAVATFNVIPPKMHRLTVAVDKSGSVTSQPGGINCPGSGCSADFGEGTTVMLTAAPASGWVFGGWSGACSGVSDCSVRMDADASVRATFNPPPPPPPPAKAHMIVSVEGNGQVSGSGINCGFGSTACDVTVNAGTNVSLTATPGDQVRFMGWSGACSGGGTTCGIAANGQMRLTAKFQDVLTTLVANDRGHRTALALNSTDVFYARSDSVDGGSIWAVSKSGGRPRRVALGNAATLAADDGYLYWSDNSSIYSVPVGGGSASQIFSSGPQGYGLGRLALDANGALYFSNYEYDSTGSHGNVNRMQNRVTTVLVANIRGRPSSGIEVDDKYVYFGANDTSQNGFLQRVPKTGGAADTMNACGPYCYISSIKADGAWVFFTNLQHADVLSIPKAGGSPTVLSARNDSAGAGVDDLDANAGVAYWVTVRSYGETVSGVFSANPDGSNWTTLDTGADNNWQGPRVDSTAVYYWHAGSLLRRLK